MKAASPPSKRRSITIDLLRQQAAFCYSDAIYRACHAGIGGGKSFIIAFDLFSRAEPDRTYMIAAPTYRQLTRSTLESIKKLDQKIPFIKKLHKADMVLELRNGARVFLSSMDDPDSARGPNLSGVALDEASLMEEEAYDIAIGRLREEGQQGWLSSGFTPKGMTHWTYKRFGTPQPDTAVFHWTTADNHFNHAGFAETLNKQYVGAWALQELGGQFMAMEGAEFDASWFNDGIWFEHWPKPTDVVLKVISLDPSKGKDARAGNEGRGGDYSAFVIFYLCRDGSIYCDADLDNRRTTPRIVEDGMRLYLEHQPNAFVVEVNQYQELLAQQFMRVANEQKLILPMYGISNSVNKEVRIRTLAPLLAGIDGRVRFKANSPGANLLVAQLRDFRAPPRPSSYHDDGPDAMEGAYRMLLALMRGEKANIAGGAPKVLPFWK